MSIVHIYYLKDKYYTKSQLGTSGQSAVHWENIVGAPSYGVNSWTGPVKYRVLGFYSTAAATALSPNEGDSYVNTDDDHFYKYVTGAWTDFGISQDGDRVISLAESDEAIFMRETGAWVDQGTPPDGAGVIVDDDGDGKSAQYVYEIDTTEWKKIGDIDFNDHFDGGSNKHDASEIDVEGTYANIPGTPSDLETALAAIDAELGSAKVNHNTLDAAYDQGGAGLGRTINADNGAVVFDATGGTNAPMEIPSLSAVPTTGVAADQIINIESIPYIQDSTRNKWLSFGRQTLAFGRKGNTKNQYVNFHAGVLPSNLSGYRMARKATIVSVTTQLSSSGTCTVQLRKNDSTSSIGTLGLTGQLGNSSTNIDIDLDKDEYLQCYISGTNFVRDPIILVEVAWRVE